MSATNGTFYSEKSMNGIITLDDGMGAVIEGGEMTITDITADNIYCDNIQTKSNTEDAYLYTNTTGNIFIGTGAILNTNHIKCNDLQGELQGDSVTLYTETTSGNIELGSGQDALSILKIGNQNNTNLIGGISVVNQAIEPDYLDQNMYVGSNLTTGNLIIANSLADVRIGGMTINNQDINAVDPNDTMGFGFNMGTTAYLTIGNSTNNNMIGNIHITGQTLTTEYPSQPVNLFNDLITSTLSFCGGMTSGILNVATAMTTGFVNIGTYMTVGAVNIGSSTCNVLLNNSFLFSGNSLITQSATLALNLFNNITTATVSMLNGMTSGTFNLCNNLLAATTTTATQSTSSFVNVGSVSTEITLGTFRFFNTTLSLNSSTASTVNLLNNLLTGIINFGNGLTTGTINMATGMTTGIINMATGMTTGSLNLGSLTSNTNIGSWRFTGSSLLATSISSTYNLLTNLTNQTLNIATTMVGSINIGSAMSLGNINIGSQFTTNRIGNFTLSGNDITTGSASLATNLFDNLTSATCSICNSMTSGIVRIGSTMSSSGIITLGSSFSTINIGNFKFTGNFGMDANFTTQNYTLLTNLTSGNLTIGHAQNQTGNIIINRPITLGYTTIPTYSNTQIGFTTRDTINNTGTIPNFSAFNAFTSYITLPVGVWLITYSLRLKIVSGSLVVVAYNTYGIDNTGSTAYGQVTNTYPVSNDSIGSTGTFVLASTGSTTYNVSIFLGYTSGTPSFNLAGLFASYVQRTRIA